MNPDLDGVVERLGSIAEELADMAMTCLREAIDANTEASWERRLTRARRSVEKAIALLRENPDIS